MGSTRIERLSHPVIEHLLLLCQDRSYRDACGCVCVEGVKTIQDLCKRHRPIRLLSTEASYHLCRSWSCDERLIITERVARALSLVVSHEGVFAEFVMPRSGDGLCGHYGLVLDSVQDPGNVGTILRTALAFGIYDVWFVGSGCDPWHPKIVRSAKGAQFDLRLFSSSWNAIQQLGVPCIVADTCGEDMMRWSVPQQCCVVMGNEAHGAIIPEGISVQRVTIPMEGPMESLNVAQSTAIMLFWCTHMSSAGLA